MEPTPDEAIARRLYAALDGQDTTGLAAVLDDASVLHVAGASGLAGDYQGGEAIARLLRRMAEVTGGSLRYGAASSLVDGRGRTVVVGRTSATWRGRRLDTEATLIVAVGDGVVRRARLSCADQAAGDAFWACGPLRAQRALVEKPIPQWSGPREQRDSSTEGGTDEPLGKADSGGGHDSFSGCDGRGLGRGCGDGS